MEKPVTLVSLADAVEEKVYRFSIDDNIWVFRDIARQRPSSLFENEYLGTLYRLHRKHGTRFQLNVYLETDGFDLSQMPDCYRQEWLQTPIGCVYPSMPGRISRASLCRGRL